MYVRHKYNRYFYLRAHSHRHGHSAGVIIRGWVVVMAEEGRWSSDTELTIRPDFVVVHAPFSQ
jgi:hypothetical protein